MMIDIVYFTKGKENDELKHSLRSLCRNFYHTWGKLVIIGTKPDDVRADLFIEFEPTGTKYSNVRDAINLVLEDNRINDFILMNDDFYFNRKMDDIPYFYDNTLYDLAGRIIAKYNGFTDYSAKLIKEAQFLVQNGLDVKNYELHVPMYIQKEKAKDMKKIYKDAYYCFRSTYGNIYCNNTAKPLRDVKNISDYKNKPFLSTSNHTFIRNSDIGNYIKKKFKNKCRYEQ